MGRKHIPIWLGNLLWIVRFREAHLQDERRIAAVVNELNGVRHDAIWILKLKRKRRWRERSVGLQSAQPLVIFLVLFWRAGGNVTFPMLVGSPEIKRIFFQVSVVLAGETCFVALLFCNLVEIFFKERVVCGQIHTHAMCIGPAAGEHADAAGNTERRSAIGALKCDAAIG